MVQSFRRTKINTQTNRSWSPLVSKALEKHQSSCTPPYALPLSSMYVLKVNKVKTSPAGDAHQATQKADLRWVTHLHKGFNQYPRSDFPKQPPPRPRSYGSLLHLNLFHHQCCSARQRDERQPRERKKKKRKKRKGKDGGSGVCAAIKTEGGEFLM